MTPEVSLAVFGAIYEGDPIGGDSVVIPETMYPTLESFSHVVGLSEQFLYDILVREGAVRIRMREGWVIATHAYTHDNNTSRRLQ